MASIRILGLSGALLVAFALGAAASGAAETGNGTQPSPTPTPSNSTQSSSYASTSSTSYSTGTTWSTSTHWSSSGNGSGNESGDGAGLSQACRKRFDELQGALEDLHRRWEERQRKFREEYDAARAELVKSSPTPEAWRAFAQTWDDKARALFESFRADVLQFAEQHGLHGCIPNDGTGRAWGEGHDGPRPVPAERAREPTYPAPPAGAKRGERGSPQMGDYDHLKDEKFERIRRECEAKMREIMPEPPNPGNGNDGRLRHGDGAPHEMDPALREKMERVMRECEKKFREAGGMPPGDGRDGRMGFGSFQIHFDPEASEIIVTGKHLAMVGLPEAQMMTKIQVGGGLYVDRLFAKGYLADFRPEQTDQGSAIVVLDADRQQILSVHDHPKGVINLATSDQVPTLVLDLADDLKVERTAEGLRFGDGARTGMVLVHQGSLELGAANEVRVTGKATFLVRGDDEAATAGDPKYERAVEEKRLGAEVAVSIEDGQLRADAVPYGDLEVRVEREAPNRVSARVESKLGQGKTVVLNLDGGLFASDRLRVRVAAVEPDGTEHVLDAREADSIEDVLDPHDDGDAVEYRVVKDAKNDVYEVLVSFPHFSEKKVTVESAGAIPVVPGFDAAIVAVGAGGLVGLLAVRRRWL